jgi:hypothetical protein
MASVANRITGPSVYAAPDRWTSLVVWLLFTAMAVGALGWRTAWAVLLDGVVIAAGAVLTVRTARLAVVVDDWGVTVRGQLWTRRYPWKEVRGCEVPGDGLIPWVVPRMVCSSGRRIRLWSLGTTVRGLGWPLSSPARGLPRPPRRGYSWELGWNWLYDDWVVDQVDSLRRDLWKHRRPTG